MSSIFTGMFKAGIFIQIFFLGFLSQVEAQELEKAAKALKENRRGFSELVATISLDTALAAKLIRFSDTDIDDLLDQARFRKLKHPEKIFVLNSIGYLMDEMRQRVDLPKIDWYDLPQAIVSYKKVLIALVSNRAYRPLVETLSEQRAHLIARAFRDHEAGVDLMHLATYKYYEARPEEILSFIESEPGYPYADSLILFMAADHPRQLVAELKSGTTVAGKKAESHSNLYVRQVAVLGRNPEAELLLPFVVQIADKQMDRETVLAVRDDSVGYFKMLVDARKKYFNGSGKQQNIFSNALINAIRESSANLFADQLNEMHEAPFEERFAIIKELRAEDIYYILATAGDELYTSSYLGLYNRMQGFLKSAGGDSLFASLGYDRFRDFLKIAANYNTLAAVFSASSREAGRQMLSWYIDSIEREPYSSLEKAMDVADCFTGLARDTVSSALLRDRLRSNYERCLREELVLGARLYGLLLRVFEQVDRTSDSILKTSGSDGYNERLRRSTLKNKKGEIVSLVMFFGDSDGRASFKSFRNLFKDTRWEVEETPFWIRIRSRGPEPVVFYASLPLDHEKRLDLQAQDTLHRYLSALEIEPTVLVHRGHSYFIDHTMAMMSPAIRLAVLGACGGNNFILDFAAVNPDVQIVFSKKIGKTAINDSILEELAGNFLETGKDVQWSEIRQKLENRFRSDPGMLNHFHEYIFPPHNVSIHFLNLFNRDL